MSGTVVPPGRRLPSGRAPPGLGGGDLAAVARWWYTTRARRFRLVTTTTKKTVMAVPFFARGRRFKNRYTDR